MSNWKLGCAVGFTLFALAALGTLVISGGATFLDRRQGDHWHAVSGTMRITKHCSHPVRDSWIKAPVYPLLPDDVCILFYSTRTADLFMHEAVVLEGEQVMLMKNPTEVWSSFDALSHSSRRTANVSQGVYRGYHTAVHDKRAVLVVLQGQPDSEIWSLGDEQWRPAGTLITPRYEAATLNLLPNGNAILIGGLDKSGSALDSVEIWNADDQTWSVASSLNTPRRLHSTTVLSDGGVVVVAGVDAKGEQLDSIEVWDPGDDAWTEYTGLISKRQNPILLTLRDDRVLILGGTAKKRIQRNPFPMDTWIVDPATGDRSRFETPWADMPFGDAFLFENGDGLVVPGKWSDPFVATLPHEP